MKAVAYYRISSDSQKDNTSLENQREEVHYYAQTKQIQILKEFEDVASGGDNERDGFKRAVKFLMTNYKKVDLFLVYKYDRVHRNLKDSLIFSDQLAQKDIGYVSVSQNIDTDTPQGKLFFQLVCSFAEFEKEMIAERCRDGRKAKLRKKETPGGRPPLGYDELWGIDEQKAEIVKDLFRNYLRLGSLAKLSKYAKDQGYDETTKLALSRTSLRDILKNRAYLGEFVYNGEREKHGVVWKSHHERIIASPIFGKVQKLMKTKCKSHR